MSKAYVAFGESVDMICAYDRNPAKALRKVAKLVETLSHSNEGMMLSGVNVYYDDDCIYNVSAFVSQAR